MPGLIADRMSALGRPSLRGEGRVWISICDHYEPLWAGADEATGRQRVQGWREKWPRIAERHRDSAGRPAQYSFFYPQEEYRPYLLEPLAEMTRMGVGDVEIHIHHNNEGEADFLARMTGFIQALDQQHGLLRRQDGELIFGFIHGNWALDNGLADGTRCGLNNELILLRDLGCYADFTMPSAPSTSQSRLINTIWWATDDPSRPKSYDRGQAIVPGGTSRGDLLMIAGPLGIRLRKYGKPALEVGELASYNMPSRERVACWFDTAPRVGRDIFVKLFAHGAQERHAQALLDDGGLDGLFDAIRAEAERRQWDVRYATAYQMYEAVEAAAGVPLRPNRQRQRVAMTAERRSTWA